MIRLGAGGVDGRTNLRLNLHGYGAAAEFVVVQDQRSRRGGAFVQGGARDRAQDRSRVGPGHERCDSEPVVRLVEQGDRGVAVAKVDAPHLDSRVGIGGVPCGEPPAGRADIRPARITQPARPYPEPPLVAFHPDLDRRIGAAGDGVEHLPRAGRAVRLQRPVPRPIHIAARLRVVPLRVVPVVGLPRLGRHRRGIPVVLPVPVITNRTGVVPIADRRPHVLEIGRPELAHVRPRHFVGRAPDIDARVIAVLHDPAANPREKVVHVLVPLGVGHPVEKGSRVVRAFGAGQQSFFVHHVEDELRRRVVVPPEHPDVETLDVVHGGGPHRWIVDCGRLHVPSVRYRLVVAIQVHTDAIPEKLVPLNRDLPKPEPPRFAVLFDPADRQNGGQVVHLWVIRQVWRGVGPWLRDRHLPRLAGAERVASRKLLLGRASRRRAGRAAQGHALCGRPAVAERIDDVEGLGRPGGLDVGVLDADRTIGPQPDVVVDAACRKVPSNRPDHHPARILHGGDVRTIHLELVGSSRRDMGRDVHVNERVRPVVCCDRDVWRRCPNGNDRAVQHGLKLEMHALARPRRRHGERALVRAGAPIHLVVRDRRGAAVPGPLVGGRGIQLDLVRLEGRRRGTGRGHQRKERARHGGSRAETRPEHSGGGVLRFHKRLFPF